jgi:hypothetical protein
VHLQHERPEETRTKVRKTCTCCTRTAGSRGRVLTVNAICCFDCSVHAAVCFVHIAVANSRKHTTIFVVYNCHCLPQSEEEKQQQDAVLAKKDARIQKLEDRIRRREAKIEQNAEQVEAATDATRELAAKDAEIVRLRTQLKQYESAVAAMAAISRGCSAQPQSQAVVQSTASSGGSSGSSSSSNSSSSKSSSSSSSSNNSSRAPVQHTSSSQGKSSTKIYTEIYIKYVVAHDNYSNCLSVLM